MNTVTVILLICHVGVMTADLCSSPANEGSTHKFEKSDMSLSENGDIVELMYVSGENEISVARCHKSTAKCDQRTFFAFIRLTADGDYEMAVNVYPVTRPRDETTWIWTDGSGNTTSSCTLEVYVVYSDPVCDDIHLTPDNSTVVWKCSISRIYPEPVCQFKYNKDGGGFVNEVSSNYVTRTPPTKLGNPAYYDGDCTLYLPTNVVGSGNVTFQVFMYPSVTGITPTQGRMALSDGLELVVPVVPVTEDDKDELSIELIVGITVGSVVVVGVGFLVCLQFRRGDPKPKQSIRPSQRSLDDNTDAPFPPIIPSQNGINVGTRTHTENIYQSVISPDESSGAINGHSRYDVNDRREHRYRNVISREENPVVFSGRPANSITNSFSRRSGNYVINNPLNGRSANSITNSFGGQSANNRINNSFRGRPANNSINNSFSGRSAYSINNSFSGRSANNSITNSFRGRSASAVIPNAFNGRSANHVMAGPIHRSVSDTEEYHGISKRRSPNKFMIGPRHSNITHISRDEYAAIFNGRSHNDIVTNPIYEDVSNDYYDMHSSPQMLNVNYSSRDQGYANRVQGYANSPPTRHHNQMLRGSYPVLNTPNYTDRRSRPGQYGNVYWAAR